MILLVPISPEVPKFHKPKLWQSCALVLVVAIVFLELLPVLDADTEYIDNLQSLLPTIATKKEVLEKEANRYLRHRPLLRYTPARGDWDMRRLIFANFIHGSTMHLVLNLLGIFAGVRICSTFLPFLCILAIFLTGGSLGLFASMQLTSQFSEYIPHVGASAGIFALMGTYYIYNFRYRTTYWFWFPSHRGFISFRTNWFFFVDVILLELVLSTAQFFPDRVDAVDHIAHVVGFLSGVGLALSLRFFQNWPAFLQTRGEFLYWRAFILPKIQKAKTTQLDWILEMLELNRYNDPLKLRLVSMVTKDAATLRDEQVYEVFKFFRPTFIRLYTKDVATCLRALLAKKRVLPQKWLAKTPYDSIIRLAKEMASPVEEQHLLLTLVVEYRKTQKGNGEVDRKLDMLMRKLQGAIEIAEKPPGQKAS